MAKTSYINARVEPRIKKEASKVLAKAGVKMSDAISMFLHQVVIQQQLPFNVCTRSHVPNAETRAALRELQDPKLRAKLKAYDSTEEMFRDLGVERDKAR